ncbi:hypothetical protein JB92DRAFT_2947571 [Gautieria morchelliformis]|nr:hypothetical protein JB92DRAFT_2947571 [Gautieria morchelliformis]
MLSSRLIGVGRKTLVSPSSRAFATNLLEQLSLSQLKNEARRHGLSPSGSKAALITRIKHVENRRNSAKSTTSIHRRDSSTANHSRSLATSPSATGLTLGVKLPDLSAPQELPGPQIPFLPDFWDSSRARGADAIRHDAQAEAPMRKVLVVAGTSAQQAGGPTYGESDHTESESGEDQTISKAAAPTPGFWKDVVEDIGLPQSFDVSVPFAKARDTVISAFRQDSVQQKRNPAFQSRALDPDEARGVWVLLVILGGHG